MVGYPESLTDPSYRGQILVITFPLVGNYGVPAPEMIANLIQNFESNEVQIKGLIVSDYSWSYNHHEAKKSLSDWLKEHKVPGISGIDTRMLTKLLRDGGSQLGQIVPDGLNPVPTSELYDPNQVNLLDEVSIKEPITYNPTGTKTMLAVDCGMKDNIIRSLIKRNIKVIRVPWNYPFMDSDLEFDAVFLSNGPGDPEVLAKTILLEQIKKAMDKKLPVLGICLGNQLIALASGAKTYKLPFGHRGQNQPCIDTKTEKCYMTSQNHGYAVDEKTLGPDWEVWFRNGNDNSIEGIRHKTLPFMSVQFHPESCPGPNDTNYLFDLYAEII
jgi:carbamoyl-phosphate synthase small subunit